MATSKKLRKTNVTCVDNAVLSTRSFDANGFMTASVRLARTGILVYKGSEIGRFDQPDRIFNIFRPAEALTDTATMDSFRNMPVTVDHPKDTEGNYILLDPDTAEDFIVGTLGSDIAFDHGTLGGSVTLYSKKAIDGVTSKRKEQGSVGFNCTYTFYDGVTSEGASFDGVQSDIIGNHLALVESGRSGATCKVLDSNNDNDKTVTEMTDNLKKVIVNILGVDCKVEQATSQLINRLTTDHETSLAAKDQEIADLNKKLTTVQATCDAATTRVTELEAETSEEAILAKQEERDTLIKQVSSMDAAFDCAGKTSAEIKKSVCLAKGLAKEKADDEIYVGAFFDAMCNLATNSGEDGKLDDALKGTAFDAQKPKKDVLEEARKKQAQNNNDDFIGNKLGGA